jgi:hypothetical protein
VEHTAVRGTQAGQADSMLTSHGINAMRSLGLASDLLLVESLVADNSYRGVSVLGSSATIESTHVRDTTEDALGSAAAGLMATSFDGSPTSVDVRWSRIERSPTANVIVNGSQVSIAESAIRDGFMTSQGIHGHGLYMQRDTMNGLDAFASIVDCVVEHNTQSGITVQSAELELERTRVADTVESAFGLGDGVIVVSTFGPAMASLRHAVIAHNHRAGLSNFGSQVRMSESTLECNLLDLDGEVYEGQNFEFIDEGGNQCGCTATTGATQCKAVSTNLAPPPPVEGPSDG